jgi:glyoxalase family protein
VPIYHLYYGNDRGEESTLVTSFPMRQTGRKARRGSGQIQTLCLSVAPDALPFWEARLRDHGFEAKTREFFGERRLVFEHPCGIEYELVGVADDERTPHTKGPVPTEMGVRGMHSILVSVREEELSEEFMEEGWGGRRGSSDGKVRRYELGDGGSGALIDYIVEPNRAPGSWALGEGFVHHCAFQVADFGEQDAVKGYLEGIGYTDVSDRKDRGYFDSIYVRTPGGPLFEATVSKAAGFATDEAPEEIGQQIMLSPQFEAQRDELLAQLEKIDY